MDVRIETSIVPSVKVSDNTPCNISYIPKNTIAVVGNLAKLPEGAKLLNDWVIEFTSANLVDSVLPIDHGLDRMPSFISVMDDTGSYVFPSGVVSVDRQNVLLSLRGFTVRGTWRARLA